MKKILTILLMVAVMLYIIWMIIIIYNVLL